MLLNQKGKVLGRVKQQVLWLVCCINLNGVNNERKVYYLLYFGQRSQPEDRWEAKDGINTGANVEMVMHGENMMNHKAYSTTQ